ncbi:MAG: N-acetylmuramoyl-L-alanine amidase [Rhodobacter sp.]|nr:N-acetylmuramoyl-L-alanine amidase [Rhodobacter sp.]
MRSDSEIIVHCSDTRPGWMAEASAEDIRAEIERWHVEGRGWRAIGYNELIMRDGTRIGGRDLDNDGDHFEEIGAHVRGRNSKSYGICLIGGHGSAATDAFEDHFTPDQGRALREAIADAEAKAGGKLKLSGHNEYANKACPGFNVRRWFKRKPPARTTPMQSTTLQAVAAGQTGNLVAAVQVIPQLSGAAQIVAIVAFGVVALALLWVGRERLKKWARGDK